ncbi:MAG: hypothetical protein PHR30_06425 [Gallionellaceae bacterium]|nr:hypothetical protein [Gallionellaceae bacterium]
MSDTIYQVLIITVILLAFVAQIGFAAFFAYRKQWRLLSRVGTAFLVWLVSTPLVFVFLFLLGVGACAAGCPGEPFEFILATLICAPSIVIIYWLFKYSRKKC